MLISLLYCPIKLQDLAYIIHQNLYFFYRPIKMKFVFMKKSFETFDSDSDSKANRCLQHIFKNKNSRKYSTFRYMLISRLYHPIKSQDLAYIIIKSFICS